MHARDTVLQVLVHSRDGLKTLSLQQNNDDSSDSDITSSTHQELALCVTNESHARHQNERMVKHSNSEDNFGVHDEETFESRRCYDNNNDDSNNDVDGSSPSTGNSNNQWDVVNALELVQH